MFKQTESTVTPALNGASLARITYYAWEAGREETSDSGAFCHFAKTAFLRNVTGDSSVESKLDRQSSAQSEACLHHSI